METIVWIEKYMIEAEHMIYEGRVNEGIQILNELLFEEPGYGNLHNYLGWAYMYYARENPKAEMHFRVAMQFAPDYAPPYLHMGTLMNRTGRYNEAMSFFEIGLTKPDANRMALFEEMAYALEMRGEYRKAMLTYKQAAATTANDHEVDRVLKSVKRCRKKRIALFFSF